MSSNLLTGPSGDFWSKHGNLPNQMISRRLSRRQEGCNHFKFSSWLHQSPPKSTWQETVTFHFRFSLERPIDECSTRVVERDIYQWQTLPPPWSSPKVCQGLISTTICQAPWSNQQKFVLAIKFQISKHYWQTKYLPFLSLIFWGYSQNSNFILVVSF